MNEVKKPISSPKQWLCLRCCSTGRFISVKWLKLNEYSSSEYDRFEICRSQEESNHGQCDWVLLAPREIFGTERIILISFCPGCGIHVPKLKKLDQSTYHPPNFDDYGHCLTCGNRYCNGQDPSHVWAVE